MCIRDRYQRRVRGVEATTMVRYQLNNFSKTSKAPRRAYDKERLDAELKLIGTYGLKNKREIWRLNLVLSKVRAVARQLLTMEERDPRRIFQGQALMRRMIRYGVLEEDRQRLDYVLALKVENFMERRLQTIVFKRGLARSVHHARVLIRQKHIRVGRQIVDIPSFMVRVESQPHIEFALSSPFGGGRGGRVKRKSLAAKGGAGDEDDE
eukprot:TRINITY_DN16_c0_g1_i6.p1 TRINITY_DN16_c0_g1~~TRINITY_DN16_c0_g1_i6.p1  ORF type:complete len:209 (-),score=57.08 TRINITY_DN16_c0_g1_i6:217-843(-)